MVVSHLGAAHVEHQFMIITCPACQTRYKVDPKNFGAKGRRVRCTNCKETWSQGPTEDAVTTVDPEAPLDQDKPAETTTPPAEAPAPAPAVASAEEPAPAVAQPAPAQEPRADEPEPAKAAESPSIPAPESGLTEKLELPSVAAAGPNRPTEDGARSKAVKSSSMIGWVALVTVVLAVLVGGVLARDTVVSAWPPAERLYAAAGLSTNGAAAGLRIEVVSHNHTVEEDRTFLVVRGKVTNTSGSVRDVPELQAWIRGEDSRELANWTFTAAQTRLLPGETASFITRFQNPPTGGTGLAIDFAQRGP
jgi:predicted Zn finger-like uncharacterized protein